MDDARSRDAGVEIVPYGPEYREAFRRLNEIWISQYFTVEPVDRRVLDAPETEILEPGGRILVALLEGQPVGVCALLRMGDGGFELSKMAVAAEAQGRGIGQRLGQAAIQHASAAGASRLYLESNTVLGPAIALYRKLGFREVTGSASVYGRTNIRMELVLNGAPAV